MSSDLSMQVHSLLMVGTEVVVYITKKMGASTLSCIIRCLIATISIIKLSRVNEIHTILLYQLHKSREQERFMVGLLPQYCNLPVP